METPNPDQIIKEARDEDLKWLGQQALLPRNNSTVKFSYSPVALQQKLNEKNTFWSRKYVELYTKYEKALEAIGDRDARIAQLEKNEASELLESFIADEEADPVETPEKKNKKPNSRGVIWMLNFWILFRVSLPDS